MHDEYSRRHPHADRQGDFLAVPEGDPILRCPGYLVRADPGDLILWDSRTIHCNGPALYPPSSAPQGVAVPGPEDLLRLVGYVCCTPSHWAAPSVRVKRAKAALELTTSTHWPHAFVPTGFRPPWMPMRSKSDYSRDEVRLILGDTGCWPGDSRPALQALPPEPAKQAPKPLTLKKPPIPAAGPPSATPSSTTSGASSSRSTSKSSAGQVPASSKAEAKAGVTRALTPAAAVRVASAGRSKDDGKRSKAPRTASQGAPLRLVPPTRPPSGSAALPKTGLLGAVTGAGQATGAGAPRRNLRVGTERAGEAPLARRSAPSSRGGFLGRFLSSSPRSSKSSIAPAIPASTSVRS